MVILASPASLRPAGRRAGRLPLAEHAEPIPAGRLNEPSDIASALLFLVCDLSANVTGQTLVVDGGVTSQYAFR